MTTMHGLEPERFEFEVIGINRNFLPKMDIILVRSEDPKLAVTGFWQGMSGSPLYIEGKLACAFSYGFRFNKVAIGGCTPIEYMKKEGFDTPRRIEAQGATAVPRLPAGKRAVGAAPAATMADWLAVAPGGDVDAALERLGKPREPWLLRAPLPKLPRKATGDDHGMVAAAVPLAMSGFTSPAFAEAKSLMADYPIEPMRAGGTGDPKAGPGEFTMGGSIGVQLIRGDMSATATGTVSYVDGHRVLAFGHPMFQAGEIYAPVAVSEVHTVIPSAMNAFVIASPMREIGALVQDRQSTIMADTSLKTSMIPIDITVTTDRGRGEVERGDFHVEVLNNRFMTAGLAGVAAMNAASYYLPDRDHATAYMESTVHVRGHEPLHFVDYLYSEGGAERMIGASRGLRVLVPLLMNPFAPVQIERIELDMKITYATNYGTIESLRLPTATLQPGKRSYVDVVLRSFDNRELTRRVPFNVPARLAGSIIRLEVSAGDSATLDAAPPENLEDLLAAFRKLLPGNVFAVTLYSAEEGVALEGTLVRDLPPSALDRIKTVSSSERGQVYRPIARSTAPANLVINGDESLLVKVAERR